MFELIQKLASNAPSNNKDVSNIKSSLTALEFYNDTKTGLNDFTDDSLFASIKNYQKARNFKVDGIINPNGETHDSIQKDLSKNKKAQSVFEIYTNNWQDMKEADTIGADKYFHCKANYQAAKKGLVSKTIGTGLNYAREAYGYLKGDGLIDVKEDMEANEHGQNKAFDSNYSSAEEACAIFRPRGLNEKY